jgi:hypothetical protein
MVRFSRKTVGKAGESETSGERESLSIARDPKSEFERAPVFRRQRFRTLRAGFECLWSAKK